MELFLMRYAEAERPTPFSQDRLRSLTTFGAHQHQQVIRVLAPLLEPLDYLITSPFQRTRQTADITAAAVTCTTPVEETTLLANDFTLGSALNLLQTYPTNCRLLCIGHEPSMSRLAALFLDIASQRTITFEPGSVIGLTFRGQPHPGQGLLQFFLHPQNALQIA